MIEVVGAVGVVGVVRVIEVVRLVEVVGEVGVTPFRCVMNVWDKCCERTLALSSSTPSLV